ncbi:hypothetical protein A1O1_03972 [Capronia coronata CBS 617.96]|uniref:Uncharacterized protein n=1 Tax=Capronia coronata CBS 617.96 TaxID=1182541 RepID=W9YDE2_9EURO|nr:uncharacterized protein A1O1_03972 [Capronia coronata CBS 617.96]EXJ90867.1 hypothetical protein A1O1_03972 [Capronia coronata CBS 617.96]
MELQLRQLQDELHQEHDKQTATEEEIGRLKREQFEDKRNLEISEAGRKAGVAEGQRLQGQVMELEAKLTATQQSKERLDQASKLLEEKAAEVTKLKQCLKEFETLKEDLIAQRQQIRDKDLEIQAFTDQVQQLKQTSAQLEEQIQEQHKLAEEKSMLEKEIASARQELNEMADMKNDLHQRDATISELGSMLTLAQKAAAEGNELRGQCTSLTDRVLALTADLEGSRKENEQVVSLGKTLQAREEEIVQLKQRLDLSEAQSSELSGVKETLQHKEEDIANLQQQILNLEGAVSNARLDQQMSLIEIPRRVADRAGSGNGTSNNGLLQASAAGVAHALGSSDQAAHVVLPHQLTGVSVIVPETQLDAHPDCGGAKIDAAAQRSPSQEDSTSELSEYTSNVSDLEHSANNVVRKKPKTSHVHKPLQTPRQRDGEPPAHPQITGRTPSSSYGSLNDQMLLDQVTHRESQAGDFQSHLSESEEDQNGDNGANSDQHHSVLWGRTLSKSGRSPKGLRSGPQTRTRDSTPFPDPTPELRPHRESTPAVMRERYQPNSAAKRRVEHDDERDVHQEQSRRLKRRPANLEIRPPRASTPKSQGGDQAASRVTLSFRKSSSVIGTNAPAPGKSQRTSNPARRGSRQDKYSNRFAA